MIKTSSMILIITVIVSWLIYLFPKPAIEPGDLLEKHRQLEESCLSCHDTFTGPSTAKCLQCHPLEKIGVYTVNGQFLDPGKKQLAFHANLAEDTCISCHKEHQGAFAAKRTIQFSHEMLGIKSGSNCVDCHQKPASFLHQQVGQNCVQCHETTNWNSSEFTHDGNFKFDSDHPSDCTTCHPNSNYQEYTCFGCHEHTQLKIAREHAKEGIRDYQNCSECHPSGNKHDIQKSNNRDNQRIETRDEVIENRNIKSKESSDRSRKSRNHSDKDGHKDRDDHKDRDHERDDH